MASQLAEMPRAFADRTSISGGIDFAITQIERAPFEAHRRTIDVSCDGTNNSGHDVSVARDEVVRKGVTINGLCYSHRTAAALERRTHHEATRVAAIRELLDRAYGKSTQYIAGDEEADAPLNHQMTGMFLTWLVAGLQESWRLMMGTSTQSIVKRYANVAPPLAIA